MKKILSLTMLFVLLLCQTSILKAQKEEDENGSKEKQGMEPSKKLKKLIPDLTDDQIKSIKKLSTSHRATIKDTRKQIRDKEDQLEVLQTKETPNMVDINKIIDEVGALRIQMHKASASHRQEIRNLLNTSQKIAFDKIRPGEMMRHRGGDGPHDGKGRGHKDEK